MILRIRDAEGNIQEILALRGERGYPGADGADGETIASVERTSGDGTAGSTDTYTITTNKGNTYTFQVYNGKDGASGDGAGDMVAATYDPQGRATDIFKYVDDKLADIDMDATADEVAFSDGETFQQKYDSGELTGPAGVGIESVAQTTTSTEDGGDNIITVTLTNGQTATFTVKNGSKGSTGADGYTPVKGTDYFTDEDKAEIVSAVMDNFTDVSEVGA